MTVRSYVRTYVLYNNDDPSMITKQLQKILSQMRKMWIECMNLYTTMQQNLQLLTSTVTTQKHSS
jgi:hypothetical protein